MNIMKASEQSKLFKKAFRDLSILEQINMSPLVVTTHYIHNIVTGT